MLKGIERKQRIKQTDLYRLRYKLGDYYYEDKGHPKFFIFLHKRFNGEEKKHCYGRIIEKTFPGTY